MERRQPIARHHSIAGVNHTGHGRVLVRGDDLDETGRVLTYFAAGIPLDGKGTANDEVTSDLESAEAAAVHHHLVPCPVDPIRRLAPPLPPPHPLRPPPAFPRPPPRLPALPPHLYPH